MVITGKCRLRKADVTMRNLLFYRNTVLVLCSLSTVIYKMEKEIRKNSRVNEKYYTKKCSIHVIVYVCEKLFKSFFWQKGQKMIVPGSQA